MPTPRAGESKEEWISRCMGDPEARDTYPTEDQLYAACLTNWENDHKGIFEMEYKNVSFEIDSKGMGNSGEFSGYASVFGNEDQGRDIIVEGAFDQSLEQFKSGTRKPKMLWQHDPSQPIGVWEMMSSDSKGLWMKGRILTEISRGAEAYVLMKEKAVDGLSIGYKPLDYSYDKNAKGDAIRKLNKVDLWETSVVTFPMNTEATVTDVKQLQSPQEVERLLRKEGVPGTFAKLVASYGYEGAMKRLAGDHRDDGGDEAELQAGLRRLFDEVKGLKEIFNA